MPEDLTDPNEDTKGDEEILSQVTEEPEPSVEEPEPEEEKPTEEQPAEEAEEEEELTAPRPTFKAITTKFPDLFKEFPALRHTFFREQKFSQIFPSIEEAQELSERATQFDKLEESILTGDPTLLLDTVRESDSTAFGKFVENLLPTLYNNPATKHLYYEVTGPVVQNVLRAAFAEGKKHNNTNLEYAAQYINEFLFGSLEIAPPKEAAKPDPEREKLEQEKAEFYKGKLVEFKGAVDNIAIDRLRRDISSGLEETLSPFLRGKITDEVLARIDKQVAADPQHMRLMDSLWQKAIRGGMTKEFQSRLTAAYLERAKPLVSAIRDKVVKEALQTKESKGEEVKYRPHREIAGGPAKPSSIANIKAKDIDWNKTTDADVIDAAMGGKSVITLRKR